VPPSWRCGEPAVLSCCATSNGTSLCRAVHGGRAASAPKCPPAHTQTDSEMPRAISSCPGQLRVAPGPPREMASRVPVTAAGTGLRLLVPVVTPTGDGESAREYPVPAKGPAQTNDTRKRVHALTRRTGHSVPRASPSRARRARRANARLELNFRVCPLREIKNRDACPLRAIA
jgi:hypothetical protein